MIVKAAPSLVRGRFWPRVVALAVAGAVLAGLWMLAVPTQRAAAREAAPPIRALKAAQAAGITIAVSAHRGGAQQWPQNSLVAFKNALDAGYAEIEGDTWITADGVTVIEHDAALNPARCSGPYVGQQIWTLTFAQVEANTCEGQPIPTEAQLLDLVKTSDNATAVLRLETKSFPGQSAAGARQWAYQVGEQVVEAGLAARSVMQDANWSGIAGYHQADPSLRVSALVDVPSSASAQQAKALGAYDLSYNASYATGLMNRYLASIGLVPTVWNVDPTPNEAGSISAGETSAIMLRTQALISLGVRVLIMNNPKVGVEAVAARFVCSQSPWRNTRDRTVRPSSAAKQVSYWRVASSPASPIGSAWSSIVVTQSYAATVRIKVAPEGFPSGARLVTLRKNRAVHLNVQTAEYGGIRIDSTAPVSRVKITTTGFYPWTCSAPRPGNA